MCLAWRIDCVKRAELMPLVACMLWPRSSRSLGARQPDGAWPASTPLPRTVTASAPLPTVPPEMPARSAAAASEGRWRCGTWQTTIHHTLLLTPAVVSVYLVTPCFILTGWAVEKRQHERVTHDGEPAEPLVDREEQRVRRLRRLEREPEGKWHHTCVIERRYEDRRFTTVTSNGQLRRV